MPRTAPAEPFFIVGSARSGTTLLRLMLNAHPDVAVPSESRFIVELWPGVDDIEVSEFLTKLSQHRLFALWNVSIEAVRSEIGTSDRCRYSEAVTGAYRAFAAVHGKSVWGDKTPRYVEHIPLLAKLFPTSRFIHLVRDGRDVALSYANVPFGPKTIAQAALLWSQRVRMGIKDGRELTQDRYLEIKYEDLTADPERELVALCDFLDLDFSPHMLDHAETARDLMLPRALTHNPKISQPPAARSRDWRTAMPATHVAVFESIAGDVLDAMEYERRFPSSTVAVRARAALGRIGLPIDRLRRVEEQQ